MFKNLFDYEKMCCKILRIKNIITITIGHCNEFVMKCKTLNDIKYHSRDVNTTFVNEKTEDGRRKKHGDFARYTSVFL